MGKSILKSAALIFVLTVVSKVLGFFKSVLQAYYFGADEITDAFYIASNLVSNVIYMITSSVAVAFVPIYIQEKNSGGSSGGKAFAQKTLSGLTYLSIVLTVLLEIAAPAVVKIAAPSFQGKRLIQTVYYYRVLLFGVVFSLCTNIYVNILNAEKVYGFSAVTSVINSLVLIAFIIFGHRTMGILAFVLAVPVSYFVQWVVLSIKGAKFAPIGLCKNPWDRNVKMLCVQALPVLASYASVEINQMVDGAILSGLQTGAVTTASYGATLNGFVSACINLSLSTVLFTEASQAVVAKDKKGIQNGLLNAYYGIFLIGFPILIVTVLCAEDIVAIVYARGAFGETAVQQTAIVLRIYGIGLMAGLIKAVLNRVYYAYMNMKTPMVFGILEVALNILLSLLLSRFIGLAGVIAGTVCASITFTIVTLYDFNRRYFPVASISFLGSLWKIAASAALVFLLAFFVHTQMYVPLYLDFIVCVCLVFAAYFTILVFLKDTMTIRLATLVCRSVKRRLFWGQN